MPFVQHDLDELLNEVRGSEEKSKKAMADAARLADELRQEQEHAMHIEKNRKQLETTVKELQVRLDEAEGAAIKGGKKIIQKLEERTRELESELDAEQRRHAETGKNIKKHERKQRPYLSILQQNHSTSSNFQHITSSHHLSHIHLIHISHTYMSHMHLTHTSHIHISYIHLTHKSHIHVSHIHLIYMSHTYISYTYPIYIYFISHVFLHHSSS